VRTETKDSCPVTWTPFSEMEGEWREALINECDKPYFRKLAKFLDSEIKSQKKSIFPPANKLFTAFNLCQLNAVKGIHTYLLLYLFF
jgi:uracil DNA glycosylase